MLTIWVNHRLGISAIAFRGAAFEDRVTGPWRAVFGETAAGRSGWRGGVAQVGHHDLSAGRPAPSGHVRPQAGRSLGDSRRVQTDRTNVPGIEICEHLPRLASMMDRLAPIRSIVGSTGSHYSFQCMTGRGAPAATARRLAGIGFGRREASRPPAPRCRRMSGFRRKCGTRRTTPASPDFWGPHTRHSEPDGEGHDDLVLQGITLERLADRQALVGEFDRFRREADDGDDGRSGRVQRQAFGVLTSSRLSEALDLSKRIRRSASVMVSARRSTQGDRAPRLMQHF